MTDILAGDIVKCRVSHYKSYYVGQLAEVLDVDDLGRLVLRNTLSDCGTSIYKPENWAFSHRPKPKEKPIMAPFEKTKYFGVRLTKVQANKDFLYLDEEHMTGLVDSKAAAIKDVQESIKEGEEFVVLQIIAKIAPAEPKPPIVVTEYR